MPTLRKLVTINTPDGPGFLRNCEDALNSARQAQQAVGELITEATRAGSVYKSAVEIIAKRISDHIDQLSAVLSDPSNPHMQSLEKPMERRRTVAKIQHGRPILFTLDQLDSDFESLKTEVDRYALHGGILTPGETDAYNKFSRFTGPARDHIEDARKMLLRQEVTRQPLLSKLVTKNDISYFRLSPVRVWLTSGFVGSVGLTIGGIFAGDPTKPDDPSLTPTTQSVDQQIEDITNGTGLNQEEYEQELKQPGGRTDEQLDARVEQLRELYKDSPELCPSEEVLAQMSPEEVELHIFNFSEECPIEVPTTTEGAMGVEGTPSNVPVNGLSTERAAAPVSRTGPVMEL